MKFGPVEVSENADFVNEHKVQNSALISYGHNNVKEEEHCLQHCFQNLKTLFELVCLCHLFALKIKSESKMKAKMGFKHTKSTTCRIPDSNAIDKVGMIIRKV